MSRNNIIAVSWDHSTLARIYAISCPCLVVPVMFPKIISTILVSNGSSFRAKNVVEGMVILYELDVLLNTMFAAKIST